MKKEIKYRDRGTENIRNQAVAQVYDKKVLVNKQKVDRPPTN